MLEQVHLDSRHMRIGWLPLMIRNGAKATGVQPKVASEALRNAIKKGMSKTYLARRQDLATALEEKDNLFAVEDLVADAVIEAKCVLAAPSYATTHALVNLENLHDFRRNFTFAIYAFGNASKQELTNVREQVKHRITPKVVGPLSEIYFSVGEIEGIYYYYHYYNIILLIFSAYLFIVLCFYFY